MALSFATDIRPLFRDEDITCMDGSGVHLDDPAWMSAPANAQSVYDQVSTGRYASRCALVIRSCFTFQAVDGRGLPRIRNFKGARVSRRPPPPHEAG